MNFPLFFFGVISPRIVKFKGEKNPTIEPYRVLNTMNSISLSENPDKIAKINIKVTHIKDGYFLPHVSPIHPEIMEPKNIPTKLVIPKITYLLSSNPHCSFKNGKRSDKIMTSEPSTIPKNPMAR